MTPERWERVKTLYDLARARPQRERSAFLARECNGDTDLQLEVESLLDQPAGTAEFVSFLGGAANALLDAPAADVGVPLVGRRVGTFEVRSLRDARAFLETEPWIGDSRELRGRIREALRLCGEAPVSAEALLLARDDVPSFKEAKRAFETRYVVGLLRRCGGNISRAARLARKDRKDFYDVIRRTGVDPASFRS